MAITLASPAGNRSASVVNVFTAKFTSDAAGATDQYVNCGFAPRYVQIYNQTDLSTQEWMDGMGTAVINSVAAGTMTNVASGVVVDNYGVTLKAAIIPASKTFYIVIHG